MQKRRRRDVLGQDSASKGRNDERGSRPFFSKSFDDLMERERADLNETVFICDTEGLGIRRRHLSVFKIPWESAGRLGPINGLSFEGFFEHCRKPRAFFSDGELKANQEAALRKEARKFFLRLDADKDGIIGPSDADEQGYVTEDSGIACNRHRRFSSDAPYGSRVNPGLARLHEQIDAQARWTERSIKEKSRPIKAGKRVVYSYDLQVHYLPPSLQGTTILHISDIHFRGDGSDASKIDFLSSLPSVLEKPPKLVLITGDFITRRMSDMGEGAYAALERLFPQAFRAFVLGNHDIRFGDSQKMSEALSERGYLDLTNKHAQAHIGGAHINVNGMDDFTAGKPKCPSVPAKLRLETNILITHNLDAVNGSCPGAFDLILSGHTHAGEKNFVLFSGLDYLRFFTRGFLDRNNQGKEWKMLSQRTTSYVSPGLGSHSGMRFNTEKEGVTLISLWAERRPPRQGSGEWF
jgi:predicted MPP superfamily phosphohydrolase